MVLFSSDILLASVFSDFTLHYRSVVLKLDRVAEHLEVMGLFAEHHEILINLIPLYKPGAILLAKNYDYIKVSNTIPQPQTHMLQEKRERKDAGVAGLLVDTAVFPSILVCAYSRRLPGARWCLGEGMGQK